MTPAHYDAPKSNLRGVVKSAPPDIKKRSYYFYEPYKNALVFTYVHLLSPIALQKLNPGHEVYIRPQITASFCMHGRIIYQVSGPRIHVSKTFPGFTQCHCHGRVHE